MRVSDGRFLLAAGGLRLPDEESAMNSRDRKDTPHPDDAKREEASESTRERASRKAKESAALDEALQETFPTSDPVSPFVPAVASESGTGTRTTCAHAGCNCGVATGEEWCSEHCRAASHSGTGTRAQTPCGCGHAGCSGSQRAAM